MIQKQEETPITPKPKIISPSQPICFEIFPKPKEQQGIALNSLIKGIHQMKTNFQEFEGGNKTKSSFTFEMCFEKSRYRFLGTSPKMISKTLQNKFKQAWEGSDTLEISLPDDLFNDGKSIYADVVFGKKGVLPLSFNATGELMKSNEPLSSLTTVAKTLTKKEAFMVQYTLIPISGKLQNFQRAMAQNTIDELKNGAPEELTKMIEQGFKIVSTDINSMLDDILEGLFEQKVNETKTRSKSYLEATTNNKTKLDQMVSKNAGDFFKMRIRVFVKAPNPTRRSELLYEIYSSLKTIEGYNQLNLLPAKTITDHTPFERQFKNERQIKHFNHVTSKELHTLLAPPSKTILSKNHQIRQIASEEVKLSPEFFKGTIPLGVVDPLNPRLIYQPTNDLDVFMLPKALLGPPGSGKTTYLIWYVLGLTKLKHNVFIFDYIKNAELTKEITNGLPENMYEIWDFSDPNFSNSFSLSYPEAYWDWKQEDFQTRYDIADRIKDHISLLLEALNEGKALGLTAPMQRTLGAVAKAVFVHKNQTLYNFYQVLTDYDVRMDYVKRGKDDTNSLGESILDQDDIDELVRLNETERIKDPETKEWEEVETGGTNLRMVEAIANRMYVFFKNNRIKKIAKNPVTDQYSLYRIFEEGKIVMVRTPQSIFSEEIRSSIVSFLTLKIWLIKEAGKFKGIDDETPMPTKENPKRLLKDMYSTHVIYDEVHQIKSCLAFLCNRVKEFRKFRICPMLTTHNLDDFGRENLQNFESCQPTYMLLTTPHKKSLEHIEDKLRPLEIKDILKLPRRYSVNIISTTEESYVFVAKSLGSKEQAIDYYLNGKLTLPSLADCTIEDIDEDDEWEYETNKHDFLQTISKKISFKLAKTTKLNKFLSDSEPTTSNNVSPLPSLPQHSSESPILKSEQPNKPLLLPTVSSSKPKKPHSTTSKRSISTIPTVKGAKPITFPSEPTDDLVISEKNEKKEEVKVLLASPSHTLSQKKKETESHPKHSVKKKGGSFMNQNQLFTNLSSDVSKVIKESVSDTTFNLEEQQQLFNAMKQEDMETLIKETMTSFGQIFETLLNGTGDPNELKNNLTDTLQQFGEKQIEIASTTGNQELIEKTKNLYTTDHLEKNNQPIPQKPTLTWEGFDETTKIKNITPTKVKINYPNKKS